MELRDTMFAATSCACGCSFMSSSVTEASFAGKGIVTGGNRTIQAPIVVINTGTSSLIPNFPGLSGTPYLT
jgi:pyruvate/2-oxoglutarate dehydrogenase complex dihydrolipoamide dehydrogenase (E3) component